MDSWEVFLYIYIDLLHWEHTYHSAVLGIRKAMLQKREGCSGVETSMVNGEINLRLVVADNKEWPQKAKGTDKEN